MGFLGLTENGRQVERFTGQHDSQNPFFPRHKICCLVQKTEKLAGFSSGPKF
jgi:hypothetical protein